MHTALPFFAVVRVSGDDRHNFLHNQLSNDINNLSAGQACYASYNSPKGRVIANMLVVDTGSELLMILAADLAQSVVKRLKMFVLRAKVQMELLDDWGVSGSLKENAATIYPQEVPTVLPFADNKTIMLPHSGSLNIAPLNELPPHDAVAEATWQAHEIRCGYPWIAAATTETCVAQMLNLHQTGAVHFRKGCYPGQEIIARAQYRGQVKRGLAVAENTAAQTAGHEVFVGDEPVGIVINVSGSLNLLVIKHTAAAENLQDENGSLFQINHLFFNHQTEE